MTCTESVNKSVAFDLAPGEVAAETHNIRNIVVCGGDLVGKTSVVKELTLRFPRAETHHGTPIAQNVSLEMRRHLRDGLQYYWMCNHAIKKYTIHDRIWCLSDIVYNPKCRVVDYLDTITMIQSAPIAVVILITDSDTIAARYKARGDEFLNMKECIAANENYEVLGQHLTAISWIKNVLMLDVSKLSAEQAADEIVDFMHSLEVKKVEF